MADRDQQTAGWVENPFRRWEATVKAVIAQIARDARSDALRGDGLVFEHSQIAAYWAWSAIMAASFASVLPSPAVACGGPV